MTYAMLYAMPGMSAAIHVDVMAVRYAHPNMRCFSMHELLMILSPDIDTLFTPQAYLFTHCFSCWWFYAGCWMSMSGLSTPLIHRSHSPRFPAAIPHIILLLFSLPFLFHASAGHCPAMLYLTNDDMPFLPHTGGH